MPSNSSDIVFKTGDGVCERLLSDATNFNTWKTQVHALLYVGNCLDLVLGAEPCPAIPTGAATPAVVVNGTITVPASTAPIDAALLDSTTRAIEVWNLKAKKAAGILFGSLSASVQPVMATHLTDPAKMWSVLIDQYDATKDEGMVFNIKEKFYNDKLNENERVNDYIDRLLSYQQQLAFTGFPLSDTDICGRLLSGLTNHWRPNIQSIRLAGQTNNLEYICSSLRSFGTFMHDEPATAAAVATANRGGQRGRDRGRGGRGGNSRGRGSKGRGRSSGPKTEHSGVDKNDNSKCNFCGRTRHIVDDCFSKDNYERLSKMAEVYYKKNGSGGSGAGDQTAA